MSSLQDGGKRKKSTGSTTAQNGTKSGGVISVDFRKWEQKGEKVERESGSGKEVPCGQRRLLSGELANGELVVGQWYTLTTMKRWGSCFGMYGSVGGADGLLQELIQGTTFRGNVGRTDGSRSDAIKFNSHFNLSSGESRVRRP